MKTIAALSLLVVMALGGCAGSDSGPTDVPPLASSSISPADQVIIDASRTSASAPTWFRDRPALDTCGVHVVSRAETVDAAEFECLADPDLAAPAELVILRRTVEGDPVVTYYRVRPGDQDIEVLYDNTLDAFGSRSWERTRLPRTEVLKRGI